MSRIWIARHHRGCARGPRHLGGTGIRDRRAIWYRRLVVRVHPRRTPFRISVRDVEGRIFNDMLQVDNFLGDYRIRKSDKAKASTF